MVSVDGDQFNFAPVPVGALVPMLACPQCGRDVELAGDSLRCTSCTGRYELSEGVPVFARRCVGSGGAQPLLYDLAQLAFGGRRSVDRVRAQLMAIAPSSMLDVGGGTGFYASAVPVGARYVVADLDAAKLRRLQRRVPGVEVILADATRLPVRTDAFDVALFIAVAHHLSDTALDLALAELARVARRRVVFIDPVASPRRTARALWRLDRGSSPRSASDLTSRATRWFDLEHVETYSIRHDYVLWVGSPIP